MKAKICGITSLDDANFAIEHGAWALGLNFHPDSPRVLDCNQAESILQKLRMPIIKIGIFVTSSLKEILLMQDKLHLDYVQVYQNFDCEPSLKSKMILALNPIQKSDIPALSVLEEYAMVLLDAPRSLRGEYGGTGQLASWQIARDLAHHVKLILAGGLNPENVSDAIEYVKPFGVDICSGIEKQAGKKDLFKLAEFLKKVKNEK